MDKVEKINGFIRIEDVYIRLNSILGLRADGIKIYVLDGTNRDWNFDYDKDMYDEIIRIITKYS